jgi:hypothetical protein
MVNPRKKKSRHYMKKPQKPDSDQFYKELPQLIRVSSGGPPDEGLSTTSTGMAGIGQKG